jgi:hypothetical protein
LAYADQRAADGLDRWRTRKIDARLATIEDDLDSGTIGGGGGSDPWTYVSLGSDFTHSTTLPVDVTGLSFSAEPSKKYEIEGRFLVRSAAVSTGVQVGLAWPSNTDTSKSACHIASPSSASAIFIRNLAGGVDDAAQSLGAVSTTAASLAWLTAVLFTTSGSADAFQIRVESEIGASQVRIIAGSFIRYREIP